MTRSLASLPTMWATVGAAGEIVSNDTGIALGMFIAGIMGTIAIVWHARGVRDDMIRERREASAKLDAALLRINSLERDITELKGRGL